MGRHSRAMLTMLALTIAAPASAQVTIVKPFAISGPQATREDVIARLMSFDLDQDGRVTRVELPERMYALLTRGDVNNDLVLDSHEVQTLAESPAPQPTLRQFQVGQYGVGAGFGLDTRLHIEGAIEDLRLAGENRDRALAIARVFEAARSARITSELVDTMAQVLTPGSLEDFTGLVERTGDSVRAIERQTVTVLSPDRAPAVQQAVTRMRVASFDLTLARSIDKYGLQPDEQQRARAAIAQYHEQKNGRLSETDRLALLDELRPVLDDVQRDDLRAALERRPIVKQPAFRVGIVGSAGANQTHRLVLPAPAAEQPQAVRTQTLVFTP